MIPFTQSSTTGKTNLVWVESKKGMRDWPEGNLWVLEMFCLFMGGDTGVHQAIHLRVYTFLEVLPQ